MLLGSGELGREVVISAKRLGQFVIAVDRYPDAPAMQLADKAIVIDMLDGEQLEKIIKEQQPDFIIPEVEAIRTEKLIELENQGFKIIPTANATFLTMDRKAIRERAAEVLGLRTARYAFADSYQEFVEKSESIGFPMVIKPLMSSSGKGQTTIKNKDELNFAWEQACQGSRGDKQKIILEEYIDFESEITLLTIRQRNGETLFVDPIAHRQENGDYQESWIPANISTRQLEQAKQMAKSVTDDLGGAGLFGVEFFMTKDEVIFSELSPRPHDTGMVTLISQNLSEFDLHVRAILGLPIPKIERYAKASASSVILAKKETKNFEFSGIEKALATEDVDVRIFRKPETRPGRRMGVVLASAETIDQARDKANHAASLIELHES